MLITETDTTLKYHLKIWIISFLKKSINIYFISDLVITEPIKSDAYRQIVMQKEDYIFLLNNSFFLVNF